VWSQSIPYATLSSPVCAQPRYSAGEEEFTDWIGQTLVLPSKSITKQELHPLNKLPRILYANINIVTFASLSAEIAHTESTHTEVDFYLSFVLTSFTVRSFITSRTFTKEMTNLIMACASISAWISSALVYVCGKQVFSSLVIFAIFHFVNRSIDFSWIKMLSLRLQN